MNKKIKIIELYRNLSEEEKKAIENLKEVVDLYNDECLITTDYDFKSIEILLNLIEKQQKEIECLNVIHESYKEMVEENNYISKDKIKEKIEEYNKMINATYEDLTHYADYRRDVCLEIKNVLQALLEEE